MRSETLLSLVLHRVSDHSLVTGTDTRHERIKTCKTREVESYEQRNFRLGDISGTFRDEHIVTQEEF